MTISIPTSDLTGILADVIPFADPDKDYPQLNCVRIEWDSHQLHAFTTDRYRIAWSTWNPDDAPATDAQDDLFTEWGGTDQPWGATLPLQDAKDLVSAYKLGPKEAHTPLTIDLKAFHFTVTRNRDSGHTAITMAIRDQDGEYPDLRTKLDDFDQRTDKTDQLAFTAKLLADFAKVRPRGPMACTFTGPTSPMVVRIGERFRGAIMPVRIGDEPSTTDDSEG